MTEQSIKVGDRVIVDLPIYRKRWQFWRPRIIGYKRWSMAVTEARLRSLYDEEENYRQAAEIIADGRASSRRTMASLIGLLLQR